MKPIAPPLRTRRANFSNLVKAAAFVRDRATCCYGVGSLWVADAAGRPEWCDHRIPASQGGSAELSNAISACYDCNYRRGNREHGPILLYAGELTAEGYAELGALPGANADHLEHMKELHWTDWFLNRAFCSVLWGAGWLNQPEGSKYKRDEQYYARAALTKLDQWRSLAAKHQITSPLARGLAPWHSGDEQDILWNTQRCTTQEQLRDAMATLAPYMKAEAGDHGNVPHCYDIFRTAAMVAAGDVM